MKLTEFKNKLTEDGTQGFEVGGCIRDEFDHQFHQTHRKSNDIDYVVCGYDIRSFENRFPEAVKIGTEALVILDGMESRERTPVYLLEIDGEKSEVALARFEQKIGDGYAGFAFTYGKHISILDDLSRRDFTVNAIARNIVTGEIVDPFNGVQAIKDRKIQGIFIEEPQKTLTQDFFYDQSNKEFLVKQKNAVLSSKLPQDPVRALRAARLACKLGYNIDPLTAQALTHLKEELKNVHPNRIYAETKKALLENNPGVYFTYLHQLGLLELFFPEIDQLVGLEQRVEFHPEGDAFVHTLQVAQAASVWTRTLFPDDKERLERNVLSAFLHDVGKKPAQQFVAEKGHYTYLAHEQLGVPLVKETIQRFQLQRMGDQLKAVTAHHMYLHNPLEKNKLSKVEHFVNGGYKRYAINPVVKQQIQDSFIFSSDFDSSRSDNDLLALVKQKEANFLLFQRNFNVSLKHKEVLRNNRVSVKEFNKSPDPIAYLQQRCLNEKELEKWDWITKEKGIQDHLDLQDFLILCASDSLGRLSDPVHLHEIVQDAALLFHRSHHLTNDQLLPLLTDWKEKYQLTDSYVSDFSLFLRNSKLVILLNQLHQKISIEVDPDLLVETTKKPDEIALLKDEQKKSAIRSYYNEHFKFSTRS